MVTRALAVLAIIAAAAAVVRADSPKLDAARRAIADVRYEDARRLLDEALRDGGNGPAALGEIYQLSARAAVVLGDRDAAERFDRRWLAIDPDASLPAGTAPKLRAPFDAARREMAQLGRLAARVERRAGAVEIVVDADPLEMIRAAVALEPAGTPIVLAGRTSARIDAATVRVGLLDEYGNRLVELSLAPSVPPPPPSPAVVPAPPALAPRPWSRRALPYAVSATAFGLTALGCLGGALVAHRDAVALTDASGTHTLDAANRALHRQRTYEYAAGVAGAAMLALAIPATIFYVDARAERRAAAVPLVAPGVVGAALVGRF